MSTLTRPKQRTRYPDLSGSGSTGRPTKPGPFPPLRPAQPVSPATPPPSPAPPTPKRPAPTPRQRQRQRQLGLVILIDGRGYCPCRLERQAGDGTVVAIRLRKADGSAYEVAHLEDGGYSCTCAAFIFSDHDRPSCKHIEALAAYRLIGPGRFDCPLELDSGEPTPVPQPQPQPLPAPDIDEEARKAAEQLAEEADRIARELAEEAHPTAEELGPDTGEYPALPPALDSNGPRDYRALDTTIPRDAVAWMTYWFAAPAWDPRDPSRMLMTEDMFILYNAICADVPAWHGTLVPAWAVTTGVNPDPDTEPTPDRDAGDETEPREAIQPTPRRTFGEGIEDVEDDEPAPAPAPAPEPVDPRTPALAGIGGGR